MSGFWLGATALGLIAVAFLIVPLWRNRTQTGRWSVSGLGATAAILPVAVGLYFVVTTFDPNAPSGASAAEAALVAQLAARLSDNPEDVAGWRLLGRSYMALGEYRLARQAFVEAWERTPNPDDELKVSLAEALIYTDQSTLVTSAADLLDEVLETDPNNQRALWWGGLSAAERSRPGLARTRWNRLLSLNLPPDVDGLVRRQLALLGPAQGEGGPGVTAGPATDGPTLEVSVRLAEGLATNALGPDSALFVLARPPGTRQPIAVRREEVDDVPGTFELSDDFKMPIATASLGDFEELSIVARLSVAGVAAEGTGDLFGETTYRKGESEKIEIVIDQVVP
jgi:cytochrome c-type biogenesis protein CcmH